MCNIHENMECIAGESGHRLVSILMFLLMFLLLLHLQMMCSM